MDSWRSERERRSRPDLTPRPAGGSASRSTGSGEQGHQLDVEVVRQSGLAIGALMRGGGATCAGHHAIGSRHAIGHARAQLGLLGSRSGVARALPRRRVKSTCWFPPLARRFRAAVHVWHRHVICRCGLLVHRRARWPWVAHKGKQHCRARRSNSVNAVEQVRILLHRVSHGGAARGPRALAFARSWDEFVAWREESFRLPPIARRATTFAARCGPSISHSGAPAWNFDRDRALLERLPFKRRHSVAAARQGRRQQQQLGRRRLGWRQRRPRAPWRGRAARKLWRLGWVLGLVYLGSPPCKTWIIEVGTVSV